MTKANTKIGDIFSVKIDDSNKKYFQLIAFDLTQLNSDVIRAFKKKYPVSSNQELMEILNDEVDFYAHCITKLGVKMGYWEKIGNVSNVGQVDHILFRDSGDYGNPQIKISQNWWVWKINQEQKQVGRLTGENQEAEIGVIMNGESIVHRMKTGKYDGFYPDYK